MNKELPRTVQDLICDLEHLVLEKVNGDLPLLFEFVPKVGKNENCDREVFTVFHIQIDDPNPLMVLEKPEKYTYSISARQFLEVLKDWSKNYPNESSKRIVAKIERGKSRIDVEFYRPFQDNTAFNITIREV